MPCVFSYDAMQKEKERKGRQGKGRGGKGRQGKDWLTLTIASNMFCHTRFLHDLKTKKASKCPSLS
jgi:hypothetical protein